MSSKDRFLTAMQNGIPDRVPATPDISCYIPCKRTGLPFWEVLFENAAPLWQAYLDAADYFGIDAWTGGHMGAPYVYDDIRFDQRSTTTYDKQRDAMIRRTTISTPDGDLTQEETCFRFEPPTMTEKPIKDLERDWPRYRWTLPMPDGVDEARLEALRTACRKREYAFGLGVGYPGVHIWSCFVQGGPAPVVYMHADRPALLDAWFDLDMAVGTRCMELTLDCRPDYIFLGGSGTITMASPALAMKYAVPAIKKWTGMAKAAGVPTLLHSCGKQRALVDMLVEHTDLSCVNPLEPPPMGDVDLAELKRAQGERIALMGNLHTTEVMLLGTPTTVRRAAIRAMRDAGARGGFILSTGDQCGRETPDENLFAMVEAVKEYGVYERRTGMLPAIAA